jgi:parallel beta-helix repeat protein
MDPINHGAKVLKRIVPLLFITLVLSALLTLPPRATAWTGGTIYIRSDGSIEPSDAPLSRVGETYYVTADINIESGKGIVIERDNITLDGNNHSIIGKEFSTGVYLYGVMNVIMRNIVIQGFSYGIWLEDSSNNTITGNNITTNIFDSSGITLLKYSSNNTITGNNIMNSAYGIWLEDSSNNTITGNNIQFTKSVYGIRLKYSSNSTITGNNITNSNFGISLEYSSNNVISGNNITINGYGILLSLSNHNTIFGNNIMNNNFGIGLWGDNNVIFHNNFINNTYQVALVEVGTNAWDDGYPSGGNYWSDYNGVDVKSGSNQDQPGSDGIGDTPYVISSLDVDHYPLMKPWASTPTPTPTTTTTTPPASPPTSTTVVPPKPTPTTTNPATSSTSTTVVSPTPASATAPQVASSTSTPVVATPGLEVIIGIVVMVVVGISLIMAFRKYKTKP